MVDFKKALDDLKAKKAMSAIYINGLLITVTQTSLTYDEIRQLTPQLVGDSPTIQYTRGVSDKPSGTVIPGQSVPLKDGMVIDVAFTGLA